LFPPIVHLTLLFLNKSIHLVPLFFNHSLKVGRGFSGVDDRKKALEGDQKHDELLFVRKYPLLAIRPAGGGGEGQRLPKTVKV
jgi:hypothetical protein